MNLKPQCVLWLVTVPELKAKSKIAFFISEGELKNLNRRSVTGPGFHFPVKGFSETARVGCLGRRRLASGAPAFEAAATDPSFMCESVALAVACALGRGGHACSAPAGGVLSQEASCGSCCASPPGFLGPPPGAPSPRPGTRVPPGPASRPPPVCTPAPPCSFSPLPNSLGFLFH